jgi:hypothetical protein
MKQTAHVFGIYETPEGASLAVDEFVRNGFETGSITVLRSDSRGSRDFAARKHTRLPLLTSDSHGEDSSPADNWGLVDPQCGPQAGSLFSALAEMDISSEWAEGAVLEGKTLLSVDCANAEATHLIRELLSRTGALEAGASSSAHAAGSEAGHPAAV